MEYGTAAAVTILILATDHYGDIAAVQPNSIADDENVDVIRSGYTGWPGWLTLAGHAHEQYCQASLIRDVCWSWTPLR